MTDLNALADQCERADALRKALEEARQFIVNGVELGYIRMPDADTSDTAHQTLPMIEAALSTPAPAQQAVDAEAVKRLESAIIHANECFEAALVEGWLDALSNGDIEAIRDLWVRRLSWVRDQFPAVLALIGGR